MTFSIETVLRTGIRSFLCLLVIAGSLSGALSAQSAGYKLITDPVDKAAAEQQKNNILQISNDLFTAGTFNGINYRLLAPAPTAGIRKYPLVLIFHNSARVGTDNSAQLDVLVKLWAQPDIRKRYPAYIVAVQFPVRSSNYITMPDGVMTSAPAPCLQTALQLTDSLIKTLPVDAGRVYTLGFSMGASTANNAMMARPELFAGGVCISGIPMQEQAEQLKHIPLWLVHGNKDMENPIPGDRALYARVNTTRNSKITFWEIDGLEHKIYPPLYTTDIIPRWLFVQKKKAHINRR